jgi:hypothetical protein
MYELAMERTVTIGGPGGSPAVKIKLLHAAAAAAAGVILAPRFTAVASLVGFLKGVTVTVNAPPAEPV